MKISILFITFFLLLPLHASYTESELDLCVNNHAVRDNYSKNESYYVTNCKRGLRQFNGFNKCAFIYGSEAACMKNTVGRQNNINLQKQQCEKSNGKWVKDNGEEFCITVENEQNGCRAGDPTCDPNPDDDESEKFGKCPLNGSVFVAKYNKCLRPCGNETYVEPNKTCPNIGGDGGSNPPVAKTYPCNVFGVALELGVVDGKTEAAEKHCIKIKDAYKVTTEQAGKEYALGQRITDITQKIKSCEQKSQDAETCCANPYSCIGGGEPGSNQAMSVLGGILQSGNKLIAGGTASITSACKTLKNLGRSASAINAAMSQKCISYANSCKDDCLQYKDPLDQLDTYFSKKEVCDLDGLVDNSKLSKLLNNSAETYKYNCAYKKQIETAKKAVTAAMVSCNTSKQKATLMIQDSIGTQSIAEFANKCQDMSSSKNEYAQDPSTPFQGDCTNPAHYSNPICVQCRLDPSAQQCAGINLGNNGAQASNKGNGIVEEKSDDDDFLGMSGLGTMDSTDENPGLGDPSAIAPSGTSLASSGTGGGGGGGLGQDNIQALGTDPSQEGGAGGSGYNTNILGNASGGGGYTTSSMGYGSGGGYSGGRITTDIYENTPPTGIMKDGFDLREYLPGGKAYKGKSRLPAGYVQLADGEIIGPKHGNIFHMMHERYAYYDSLGKFWPAHYSKEKIECIKKSGIMNNPPYANQWDGENLHKLTPQPNPPECRHFAAHDPNKPDPTQIYLKAQAKKEIKSRTPQSVVSSYKDKSLHEIYHALTRKKDEFSKQQYNALYRLYKTKYADYKKNNGK